MINLLLAIIVTSPSSFKEFSRVLSNPLEGRDLFVRKGCIQCHSIRGTGGKFGPDLGVGGEKLTFYRFAGLLFGHSPKMLEVAKEMGLEWPEITSNEIASLFGYFYYFNYFEQPGNYERGKTLFKTKSCIKCHSVGGKGGKRGPSLDKFSFYVSPIPLVVAMWNVLPKMTTKMKKLGIKMVKFNGQDILDILAYIRGSSYFSEQRVGYLTPGNPDKGKKLFATKRCLDCHSIHGKGGDIGPDLGRMENVRSISDIMANLWNHGTKMMELIQEIGYSLPKFEIDEMSDLLAYLYSVQYYDEEGNPKKGEIIYKKKGCPNCHGVEDIAPPLADIKVLSSPFVFTATAWNHIPLMFDAYQEMKAVWPRFEDDEMRDLVSYLIYKAKSKQKSEKK